MTPANRKIFLEKYGFTCKDIEEIALKDIGSKKKLECFLAQCDDNKTIFFINRGKSRVLRGEFDTLETLKGALEKFKGRILQEKVYFHIAPMCSKALIYGKELGWSAVHVSL